LQGRNKKPSRHTQLVLDQNKKNRHFYPKQGGMSIKTISSYYPFKRVNIPRCIISIYEIVFQITDLNNVKYVKIILDKNNKKV
jgi:hypothetical protein